MSGRFLVEAFGTREVVRVVISISAEQMVEGDERQEEFGAAGGS